jgi:hypothetical protein
LARLVFEVFAAVAPTGYEPSGAVRPEATVIMVETLAPGAMLTEEEPRLPLQPLGSII